MKKKITKDVKTNQNNTFYEYMILANEIDENFRIKH